MKKQKTNISASQYYREKSYYITRKKVVSNYNALTNELEEELERIGGIEQVHADDLAIFEQISALAAFMPGDQSYVAPKPLPKLKSSRFRELQKEQEELLAEMNRFFAKKHPISDRVTRGASYNYNARYGRVSFRRYYAPSVRFNTFGFRLTLQTKDKK